MSVEEDVIADYPRNAANRHGVVALDPVASNSIPHTRRLSDGFSEQADVVPSEQNITDSFSPPSIENTDNILDNNISNSRDSEPNLLSLTSTSTPTLTPPSSANPRPLARPIPLVSRRSAPMVGSDIPRLNIYNSDASPGNHATNARNSTRTENEFQSNNSNNNHYRNRRDDRNNRTPTSAQTEPEIITLHAGSTPSRYLEPMDEILRTNANPRTNTQRPVSPPSPPLSTRNRPRLRFRNESTNVVPPPASSRLPDRSATTNRIDLTNDSSVPHLLNPNQVTTGPANNSPGGDAVATSVAISSIIDEVMSNGSYGDRDLELAFADTVADADADADGVDVDNDLNNNNDDDINVNVNENGNGNATVNANDSRIDDVNRNGTATNGPRSAQISSPRRARAMMLASARELETMLQQQSQRLRSAANDAQALREAAEAAQAHIAARASRLAQQAGTRLHTRNREREGRSLSSGAAQLFGMPIPSTFLPRAGPGSHQKKCEELSRFDSLVSQLRVLQQRRAAERAVMESRGDGNSGSDNQDAERLVEDCAICCEPLTAPESSATRCGHIFHTHCALACIRGNSHHFECPICRQRVHQGELIILHNGLPAKEVKGCVDAQKGGRERRQENVHNANSRSRSRVHTNDNGSRSGNDIIDLVSGGGSDNEDEVSEVQVFVHQQLSERCRSNNSNTRNALHKEERILLPSLRGDGNGSGGSSCRNNTAENAAEAARQAGAEIDQSILSIMSQINTELKDSIETYKTSKKNCERELKDRRRIMERKTADAIQKCEVERKGLQNERRSIEKTQMQATVARSTAQREREEADQVLNDAHDLKQSIVQQQRELEREKAQLVLQAQTLSDRDARLRSKEEVVERLRLSMKEKEKDKDKKRKRDQDISILCGGGGGGGGGDGVLGISRSNIGNDDSVTNNCKSSNGSGPNDLVLNTLSHTKKKAKKHNGVLQQQPSGPSSMSLLDTDLLLMPSQRSSSVLRQHSMAQRYSGGNNSSSRLTIGFGRSAVPTPTSRPRGTGQVALNSSTLSAFTMPSRPKTQQPMGPIGKLSGARKR